MNWIDIALLSIIGLSVVIGLFRGFVREALSLANWSLACFASYYFNDIAQQYLKNMISSSSARSLAAFVIVFLIFIVMGSLLTHFIGFLVKKSGLSGTDRMLGLLFGFCRGALVCGVILAVGGFTPVKQQKAWQEASLLPMFNPLVTWLNVNVSEKISLALGDEPLRNKKMLKGAVKINDSINEGLDDLKEYN